MSNKTNLTFCCYRLPFSQSIYIILTIFIINWPKSMYLLRVNLALGRTPTEPLVIGVASFIHLIVT